MILVIGGRSKIGSALLEELSGRGEQVRALVRAGEPTGGLAAAAEIVTGDLADEGSLVTAMTGIEKVFLLSSPHPDAVSWHRNAIDAARRTEVRLLVRSSVIGADRESPAEFVNAHTTCDRYLEDSGLPFVIVRPNLFLQNIPESTIPSIDTPGSFYLDAGQARISMVDTRDIAAVAAVVLTEPGHTGAHYDVTGPEALSYADVAAKLTTAMGRQISYVAAPDEAVAILPSRGVSDRSSAGPGESSTDFAAGQDRPGWRGQRPGPIQQLQWWLCGSPGSFRGRR